MDRPSHVARIGLVLLTVLLLGQAAIGLPRYLQVLVLLAAAGATTGALQFRRDAAVGWAAGVGSAALVVAAVGVQGTTGLPAVGGGMSILGGAAGASAALVLVAAVVEATSRDGQPSTRP